MKGKKNPTSCGEDRDGVYGKENRVYWLLRVLLLLLKSVVSELHPCNLTQLVHTLLMFLVQNRLLLEGDNRWNIWLRTFAISTAGNLLLCHFSA